MYHRTATQNEITDIPENYHGVAFTMQANEEARPERNDRESYSQEPEPENEGTIAASASREEAVSEELQTQSAPSCPARQSEEIAPDSSASDEDLLLLLLTFLLMGTKTEEDLPMALLWLLNFKT